jgi:hypothetical protein
MLFVNNTSKRVVLFPSKAWTLGCDSPADVCACKIFRAIFHFGVSERWRLSPQRVIDTSQDLNSIQTASQNDGWYTCQPDTPEDA